jgi:hypothetical protein
VSDQPSKRRGSYLDPVEFGIARPKSAPLPPEPSQTVDSAPPPLKKGRRKEQLTIYPRPGYLKVLERLKYEYYRRYEEEIDRQDIFDECFLRYINEDLLPLIHERKVRERRQK